MKVFFHSYFTHVYTNDPAAEPGRIEAVLQELPKDTELVEPAEATEDEILAAHTKKHVESVRMRGLYEISALAAGGARDAAIHGLKAPAFGLIRPPGHHASSDSSWGFCFFNNMAIALLSLYKKQLIQSALVLDVDLHYGDGTVNILGGEPWVSIYNPESNNRSDYMNEVAEILGGARVDIIGISAGFDNHLNDWGGLLSTDDYYHIGKLASQAAASCGGGCFAILEGGYNHNVLGKNVASMINGLSDGYRGS